MKKLEIFPYASTTVGFPPKSGTWDFLQLANKEGFESVFRALLGATDTSYSASTMYRIYGCAITFTNVGVYVFGITSGAIFYNGDFYLVDAFAGSYSSPFGIDVSIERTQYTGTSNADPVIFSGAVSGVNVHNIYKIKFNILGAATSGGIYFSTSVAPTIVDINPYKAWIIPTYINGYITDTNSPVKFRLEGKTVKIKGKTNNSSSTFKTTNEILFTLPVGYRPLENQRFVVTNEASYALVTCEIGTNGDVALKYANSNTNNTGTYLNISFDID